MLINVITNLQIKIIYCNLFYCINIYFNMFFSEYDHNILLLKHSVEQWDKHYCMQLLGEVFSILPYSKLG